MSMTSFDPLHHGFHFPNTFRNHVGPITTNGLCGGMSYAALDYFHAGRPIPLTRFPDEGTPLRGYIFDRQVASLVSQGPGFASRVGSIWNDDRARFRWGVEDAHELGRLRRAIDAGQPAALGLISVKADLLAHHQAVAVGYDTGASVADLRIHLYDPNFPERIVTMIPVESANCFRTVFPDGSDTGVSWRTYFVDEGYRAAAPPAIDPAGRRQSNWRYCGNCFTMAFAGHGPGACAAGGRHDHSRSGDYVLLADAPHYGPQEEWRWCRKCESLAYALDGPGVCPAGGAHDHAGSSNYVVPYDAGAEPGQSGWKFCGRCKALAYADGGAGPCPAGGTHDHSRSGDYRVVYR